MHIGSSDCEAAVAEYSTMTRSPDRTLTPVRRVGSPVLVLPLQSTALPGTLPAPAPCDSEMLANAPPLSAQAPLVNSCTKNRAWTVVTVAVVTLAARSEEHTSELQSRLHLVCRLL